MLLFSLLTLIPHPHPQESSGGYHRGLITDKFVKTPFLMKFQ